MNTYSAKVTLKVTISAEDVEANSIEDAEEKIRNDIRKGGFDEIHEVSITDIKMDES